MAIHTWRLYATRFLQVGPGGGLVARDLRFLNFPRLHDHPVHPDPFCALTEGPALQLDVLVLRGIHRRLRPDARDGGVEPMACDVLAGGRVNVVTAAASIGTAILLGK